MTKKIVYTENETVKIFTPAEKGLSDEALNLIAASVVPDWLTFSIIDEAVLPVDRTFRNAWQEAGGIVEVEISKAREIQKDVIRVARVPLMTELDYRQNDGQDISAERQRLKDFTALVDSVSDVEELKAVIPVLEI